MREIIQYPDFEAYSDRQLNAFISIISMARLVSGAVGVFAVTSVADVRLPLGQVVMLTRLHASLFFLTMVPIFTYWRNWFEMHTGSE